MLKRNAFRAYICVGGGFVKWFIVSEKKLISVFCSAVLMISVSAMTLYGIAAIQTGTGQQTYPIRCVQTQEKKIALTFDADSDDLETRRLIEVLNRYNIKSTFFLVGAWARKYPESVKALADAGHEIGNHSNTHLHMNNLSQERISAQIADCNSRIQSVTGVSPVLFRPPYGEADSRLVAAVQSHHMTCIVWSVDSDDWRNLPPRQIAERVVSQVKPGSIVLLHCGARNTATALPFIISTLQSDGYSIVPVSQLIYKDHYIVTENGVQMKTD